MNHINTVKCFPINCIYLLCTFTAAKIKCGCWRARDWVALEFPQYTGKPFENPNVRHKFRTSGQIKPSTNTHKPFWINFDHPQYHRSIWVGRSVGLPRPLCNFSVKVNPRCTYKCRIFDTRLNYSLHLYQCLQLYQSLCPCQSNLCNGTNILYQVV